MTETDTKVMNLDKTDSVSNTQQKTEPLEDDTKKGEGGSKKVTVRKNGKKNTKVTIEKVDYPLKKRKKEKTMSVKESDEVLVEKTLDKSHLEPVETKITSTVELPKLELKLEDKESELEHIEEVKHTHESIDKEEIERQKLLKEELDAKNNQIRLLKEQEASLKSNFSEIVEKINKAIDTSSFNLYKQSSNPELIYKLENIIERKERELNTLKKASKTYHKQYDEVYQKANEKVSQQKMMEMEDLFNKYKNDNESLQKKIPALKNKQIFNSRELETYSFNKKYPQQVSILTEEMKGLVAKKHESNNKITGNKKSVMNLKKYLETVALMLIDNLKSNKNGSFLPSEVKGIEESIKAVERELEGDEENILSKGVTRLISPERGDSNGLRNSDSRNHKGKISIDDIMRNKKDEGDDKYTSKAVILPLVGSKQVIKESNDKSKRLQKKYDFMTLRNNSKNKKPEAAFKKTQMNNSNSLTKSPNRLGSGSRSGSRENEKKPETLVVNDWDPILEDDDVIYDYDKMGEYDYKKLLKRTEHLMILKEKVEKGLKEKEKIYEKKFKDIESTIKENQKKLAIFKQQNELLSLEINDLTKIIKLNMEENRLRKEMKDSESKLILKNSNNISQTQQEILQDLNNLLKNEDQSSNDANKRVEEKKIGGVGGVNSHKLLGDRSPIIEEDHTYETNSILKSNVQNNNQKNLKFPDISTVEHVDEDNTKRLYKNATMSNDRLFANPSNPNIDFGSHEVSMANMEEDEKNGVMTNRVAEEQPERDELSDIE